MQQQLPTTVINIIIIIDAMRCSFIIMCDMNESWRNGLCACIQSMNDVCGRGERVVCVTRICILREAIRLYRHRQSEKWNYDISEEKIHIENVLMPAAQSMEPLKWHHIRLWHMHACAAATKPKLKRKKLWHWHHENIYISMKHYLWCRLSLKEEEREQALLLNRIRWSNDDNFASIKKCYAHH